jgi:LDH2 family malate/lactate/ureidoglycolate dehydrogenase
MSQAEFTTISRGDLQSFTESVFKAIGCSDADARQATDVLLKADLRGIDSHGVARLSGYVRLYENGRINTKPKMQIIRQKHGVFTLDGDAGLGLISVVLLVLLPIAIILA